MPTKRCQSGGKRGWKWGEGGKCYVNGTDTENRKSALAQGIAIGEIKIKVRKAKEKVKDIILRIHKKRKPCK